MTDEEFVRAAQDGDYAGFDALVRKYQDRIFGICLLFLDDRNDADDAAQEVFIKAYRSLSRFKGKAQFSTWLYRIAVNHCLNLLRARRRRKMLTLFSRLRAREKLYLMETAGGEDPHMRMEQEEIEQKVAKAIESLPDDQKTALILHRYEGLSYQEIAGVMGVSVACIESRLFRAKKKLAELLGTLGKD
ncbi:MAG: sigma-70 family RNA polymerase sigma factor [candidate division KSB1 bacterium]|nr:sigma-70 family RNA polymerase sigma factor [candidate division KSB1 bacterium]